MPHSTRRPTPSGGRSALGGAQWWSRILRQCVCAIVGVAFGHFWWVSCGLFSMCFWRIFTCVFGAFLVLFLVYFYMRFGAFLGGRKVTAQYIFQRFLSFCAKKVCSTEVPFDWFFVPFLVVHFTTFWVCFCTPVDRQHWRIVTVAIGPKAFVVHIFGSHHQSANTPKHWRPSMCRCSVMRRKVKHVADK